MGGVEWAWSPMHSRIDNYSSELEAKILGEGTTGLTIMKRPGVGIGYFCLCIESKGDERSSNAYAQRTWAMDKIHNFVDEFHWINSTGLFSVSDCTIAREVCVKCQVLIPMGSAGN